MKIALKISVIAIIIAIISFSCKKNQIGGKATLKGVVMHHDKPIGDAYVYIKYNSTEFPGDDYKLYDAYVQADANGNYSISFYKGTYYIFATGRDIDIPSPFTVNGGITVTLKNKEHLSKDIAVTEP